MVKQSNIFAWILFTLATVGILIPHVGFLSGADVFSNLSTNSHTISMIIVGILYFAAFILKK